MERRKYYNYENEISNHNFLTKSAFTEFYNFCDFVLAYEEQMGIPPEIERALPFYRQDNAPSSVNHTDEEEKQLSSSGSTPEKDDSNKGKAEEMDDSSSSSANSDSTSDEQEEEEKEEPEQSRKSTKRKNVSNQRRSKPTSKRQNRSKNNDSESDGDTSSSSSSVSINNDVELVYTSDDESWNLVTCFCRRPFAGRPMIECSKCLTWIHLSCAKIKKQSVPDVYICQQCKLKGVRRSKRKKT